MPVVAPRVAASVVALGELLPFFFCREAIGAPFLFAQAAAEGFGFVVADADDGLVMGIQAHVMPMVGFANRFTAIGGGVFQP